MTPSLAALAALAATPHVMSLAAGAATPMATALSLAAGGIAPRARTAAPSSPGARGVEVIGLYGYLVQRPGLYELLGLGTSLDRVSRALRVALADDAVETIVLDVDSPGGQLYGVQELADRLFAARAIKPVVGVANSQAGAGAYWLLSQCSECYVTPGGEVGGIGMDAVHVDISRSLAEAGVEITLIGAGKFKTEGNPYGPLSSEARAFMQSRLDDTYGVMARQIARGRGTSVAAVRDDMGQGRMLGAAAARSAGMVDGIASLDQVVANVSAGRFVSRQVAQARTAALLARLQG